MSFCVIYKQILDNPSIKQQSVESVMDKPFPEVNGEDSINKVSKLFDKNTRAVIVNYGDNNSHIITLQDLADNI